MQLQQLKKDYVNHGFGLKQIEKVTEDIRGNLFISCNDLKFSLKNTVILIKGVTSL